MIPSQAALHLGKPPGVMRLTHEVPRDWLDILPPGMECLRDYQRQQISETAAAIRDGCNRILVQAPTGAGKTHVMASIVLAGMNAGLRVLVLVTRTRLVKQAHQRFRDFGIPHGVIAASLPHLRNTTAMVQIASVDTLNRRVFGQAQMPLPSAEILLFDEAHLATAGTRLRLLDSFPHAVRIGLTATPARKSGRSLGSAFESLILGPSIKELTAAGVLVPTRIYNTPLVTQAELGAIPKDIDSDFKQGSLGELLSRPKLVGDVVGNWLRIANGKRTICFAVNKAHGAALLDQFRQQGVAAELLTDADDEEAREQVIERLESGQTQIVINCFLLAYGIDVPAVECVILARPTRSLTMYLQMVGRGLRTSAGKTHCILIDHGRVVENLGLPHSDFAWSLKANSNVNTAAESEARNVRAALESPRTCRECADIWLVSECGHACPSCGWAPSPRSKPIEVQAADLEELADAPARVSPASPEVYEFYRQACGWKAQRKPDI
jgi:superfamily II DNA or RNA helicase